jgi:hypothetical protein
MQRRTVGRKQKAESRTVRAYLPLLCEGHLSFDDVACAVAYAEEPLSHLLGFFSSSLRPCGGTDCRRLNIKKTGED